jgi:hypothetical protein
MSSTNQSPSTRQLCTLKENDEAHLVYVLKNVSGDRGRAAQILGITVRQLQRKIAAMKKNPQWESILRDNEVIKGDNNVSISKLLYLKRTSVFACR